jgi:hypothetical protein
VTNGRVRVTTDRQTDDLKCSEKTTPAVKHSADKRRTRRAGLSQSLHRKVFGRDLFKKRKDGGYLETGRGAGYGPLAHLIILLFLREVSELLTERLNTKEVSWKGEFYPDYDRI